MRTLARRRAIRTQATAELKKENCAGFLQLLLRNYCKRYGRLKNHKENLLIWRYKRQTPKHSEF